jgi:dephospho-CoA kinase
MFILGLTGGIATGKTTATDFFASKGIEIIDADEISRSLQLKGAAGYSQVLQEFGKDILDDNEEINRSALRKIAFANKTNKEKLEGIMHPLIRAEIMQGFENIKSKWGIYSAPLWSNRNKFKRTLVINSSPHIQSERIKARDNSSDEVIQKILSEQMSYKERISFADDLIFNDGSLETFLAKLDFYYKLYDKLA